MPIFQHNEIAISYLDQGSVEAVPLVFIHGALGSKNLWRDQIEGFSKTFRVIAFDVRGHGESSKPAQGYGPEYMVRDLDALLTHLEIKKAILVGSSMGGVLAQMFCISHPQKVAALVLVGTLAKAHWLSTQEEYQSTSFDKIIDKGVKEWFTESSSREQIDFALEQARMSSPNFIRNAINDFGMYDLRSKLPTIIQPTLIVVGKEDRTTPPEESEIVRNGIKNSELIIVPNCGHLVMLEKPVIFNRAVSKFLERFS